MHDSHEQTSVAECGEAGVASLTRREFLRASAASVVGLTTGLGGLLAGCEGNDRPSNTTATVNPGQTTTTTTAMAIPTSTTIVVGPETGRAIKIGVVSAMTGPLALFGRADDWWTALAGEALADGVVCGDGRLHALALIRRDSRSDPERAAEAATELVIDERVDVILCSGGTSLVAPVAAQAEALVCPCLCSFVQWRPLVEDRRRTAQKPFLWAYAHALGMEDIAANFIALWDRLQTNRKVGLLFPDSIDGQSWADTTAGLSPDAAGAGYECVLPGLYPVSSGDYTPYISEFKKSGCEICCGAFSTRDFIDFWRQSSEQEYRPKIMTVGEGLLFPHALEAIGPAARNITAECLWQPDWPYKDSITGKTCYELANDYMAKTGDQWTVAIAQYAGLEWVVDVLKRVADIDSRREIIKEVARTDLETCLGPIDFTTRVDATGRRSKRPAENVYKAPVGSVQWVEGDAFAFEPRLVTAVNTSGLPATNGLLPMRYGPS